MGKVEKALAACLALGMLLGGCANAKGEAGTAPAVRLFADTDAANFETGYLFDVDGDGEPEFCCNANSSHEGYVLEWVLVVDPVSGKKYRLCDDLSQVDGSHGPDRYYLAEDAESGGLYVAKRAYTAESQDYERIPLSLEGMQEITE